MDSLTLFGAHISPYVRKVRLVLAYLKLEYQHIPVVPFGGGQPEEFVKNSPLKKIPLLKVGENYIPDSSVICDFLINNTEKNNLIPKDAIDRARVLWFEEYADSFMVSAIGGHLFAERVLAPAIFKREPIQADIDKAINEEIPAIFDYLAGELRGDFLMGDSLSYADIAVCSLFIAMHHSQVTCDAGKWPSVSAYIDRVTQMDFFKKVVDEELMLMKSFAS